MELDFGSPTDSLSNLKTKISLFIFALVPQLGFWWLKGTTPGRDSSGYIATCSQWGTDPLSVLVSYRGIVNAGFTLPVCALRYASNDWQNLWVFLQIILFALGVVLIFDTGRRLFGYWEGIVAGVSLAVLFEAFQWSVYLLTDSLFIFLIIFSVWSISLHRTVKTVQSRLLVISALSYLAIVRPSGAPIVVGWVLLDVLPNRYTDFRIHLVSQRIAVAAAGFLSLAVAFFIIQVRELLVDSLIVGKFLEGRIVANDPTFDYPYALVQTENPLWFLASNLPHLLAIMCSRMVILYLPFVPRYSLLHIVVNIVTFVPVLIGGMVGVYLLYKEKPPVAVFLAVPILVTTLIVAVTWIDWDFRYRAPVMPVFALLTGYVAPRIPLPNRLVSIGR